MRDEKPFIPHLSSLIPHPSSLIKVSGLVASLFLIAVLFNVSRADIDIGGTISSNTTLGPTGTPGFQDTVFNVTSNLTVNAGVTLTIQPGVTLRFNSSTGLDVNGVLNAQGTATERIRFTRRAASGNWRGIQLFGSGTNASVFSRCDIEFAGQSGAGIRFNATTATMSESTVTNSSFDGVWIDGASANPTLTNVTVSNNNGEGVFVFGNGRGTLNGCTIQNNRNSGIFAFSSGNEAPTIQNCTISGNNTVNSASRGGVNVGAEATLTGNTIENNNQAGVLVGNDDDVPMLQNNTIRNNNGYPISVGANPLTNAGTRITGNTFTGNNPNRFEYRGGTLATNYAWVDTVQGLPVDITGQLSINSGITLTFNPGQLVTFGPSGRILTFGGVVRALGTPEPFSPIIFTSNAANPSPGAWSGFDLRDSSTPSQFNYCVISFAQLAFSISNTSPTFTNCTIVRCSSDAIRVFAGVGRTANPVIKNTILANNGGRGVVATAPGTATVTFSDAFGNTSGNFLNVTPGTGVIQADPLFRSATDLHLQAVSPCINTAEPPPGTPNDADNTRADMGAFPHLGPGFTTIAPTSGAQGQTNIPFSTTGVNFTDVNQIRFLLNGNPDNDIAVSNIQVVNDNQVTATLNIASGAAIGNRVVQVVSTTRGASNVALGPTFAVSAAAIPVISSINPTQGRRNDMNVAFTINGTAFTGATDVRFLFNGNNDTEITHGALTVNGLGTQITTTLNIGANAQPGDHVVVVVTPGGDSSSTPTAGNTFTVLPPPSISSLNPTTGVQGQNNIPLEIIGLNLTGASAVTFLQGGNPDNNITVGNVTVVNDTKVTAMVNIGENAQTGDRVVTVTTPNGTSSATAGANNTFTVTPAPPSVTQVNPNQGQRGMTLDVTVTGTFFQTGATVNFGAGITVNSAVVNSSTQITANVTIAANAVEGARDVLVTNPNNLSGTLTNGFNVVVVSGAPTITSVSLPNAAPGASNLTMTINGMNLTGANVVDLLFGGNPDPNIVVSNLTVVSDTQVTATVNINRNASAGDRIVRVTTPGGAADSATPVAVQVTLPPIPGGGNRLFMRSVPINAVNLDPLAVFGQNAQVARYVGNNQYLLRSNGFFPVTLGEGYFVKLPANFTPVLTAGTLAPHAPFDVALPDNDWFILGNPFLGAVNVDVNQWQVVIGGVANPLANVVGDVNGAVTFYGWKWNPDINDYELVCDPNVIPGAVSMLDVGEAMFIRTRQAGVSVRLPVPAAHPQLARKTQRKRSANDWSFRLVTTAGSAVDANTYLGVSSQGKGQGVKVEMPPALLVRQGYVETSIIDQSPVTNAGQNRDGHGARWKADLRPAVGQREAWDVEVRTDQRNADVTLNWNDLTQVPRQYRLRLTDLATGAKRAMRTVSGYTFRSNPDGDTVRRFRIELYPASEGGLRVHSLNVVPQSGLGAHVTFALTQPARVLMTVLSPTGKAVRTLPPMEAKVGLNALTWDGKAQTGASLSRGLYVVLVRAVDEEGQEVQAARSVVMR